MKMKYSTQAVLTVASCTSSSYCFSILKSLLALLNQSLTPMNNNNCVPVHSFRYREQQRRPVPEGESKGRAHGGGPASRRAHPSCLSPAGLQHFRGEREERTDEQPPRDVGAAPERPLLAGHIGQDGIRAPVQTVRYVLSGRRWWREGGGARHTHTQQNMFFPPSSITV